MPKTPKPKYPLNEAMKFILKAMKFTPDEINVMIFQGDYAPAVKKIEKKLKKDSQAKTVIEYLNWVCKKKFRGTDADIRKISARFSEGFTISDFRKVIHHKHTEWSQDKVMCQYLRPETLFGTKFDSYLQAAPEVPDGYDSKEDYAMKKNQEVLDKCNEVPEPMTEEEKAEALIMRKEKLGF